MPEHADKSITDTGEAFIEKFREELPEKLTNAEVITIMWTVLTMYSPTRDDAFRAAMLLVGSLEQHYEARGDVCECSKCVVRRASREIH